MSRGRVQNPDGTTRDIGELQVEAVCPCGQNVFFYEDAAVHKEPMCRDFAERGPLEYLVWLRKRAEKTEGA